MLKSICEVNEKLFTGKAISFPVPADGGMGLLEALLLKVRGRPKSLLPLAKRRVVSVGGKTLHVYSL